MHCLFIGKHPSKGQGAPIGAASGTELVPNIVDFANNAWLASHLLDIIPSASLRRYKFVLIFLNKETI
jgi:hypothetical protein